MKNKSIHILKKNAQLFLLLQLKHNQQLYYKTKMESSPFLQYPAYHYPFYAQNRLSPQHYPFHYPQNFAQPPLQTQELYLILKQQISDYERANGIKNEPKCHCYEEKSHPSIRQSDSVKKQIKSNQNSTETTGKAKKKQDEQNEGRNAKSNILRMFFRRLQYKIYHQPHTIDAIIKSLNLQSSKEDFAKWIQHFKIDYRYYISVPSVKKLFPPTKNSKQVSKILRILFKQFLHTQCLNCYLTSRKLKKQTISANIGCIRKIYKDLLSAKQ